MTRLVLSQTNNHTAACPSYPYPPLGHFFIAVDLDEFMGLQRFNEIAGDIMRRLRRSRKAPGCDYIFTPGEKEYLIWQIRRRRGCPVPEALRKDMTTLCNWCRLDCKFPWE